MGNTRAAFPFCISLEQFANLKEKHDEDGLRKLRLRTWQEADGQCTQCGNGHEEMLIEGITMGKTFGGFFQRAETHQQIRYKINQQQLPCGQIASMLYQHGSDEQNDS